MYLVDSSAARINNRKWNLGCDCKQPRLSGRRLGIAQVNLPNLGASTTAQSWRRLRGLRGLGDDSSAGYCTYFQADGTTPESFDFNSSASECGSNGGSWTAAINTPSPVGAQNPSPSGGPASNGGITTVPASRPSSNPLDYVSPQAAVAAGLNAATVYAAWTAALAKYPSPQAAIAAGVPAGVVNQLWQQSNVNAANAASASAASTATLTKYAMYGLGALLVFSVIGGKRR